jgi:hypothetical protein
MLQIAMAIFGIIVLCTGKLKLSANKVVVGTPARLLGLMLLAPLPVAFGIGICVGIYVASTGGNLDDVQMQMIFVDVGLVVLTALAVFAIANAIAKPPGYKATPAFPGFGPNVPPGPPPPPMDPSNPYQSPYNPQ